MTIFQKLSWMLQMGIHDLCGEEVHPLSKNTPLKKMKNISLTDLDKELVTSKSSLSTTATHPLGGIGAVPSTVMCILESPSAHEDKTGIPLSGPEGELLKKMLSSIGLDINTQTYVGYLSPWRAPGARVLTPLEIKEGLGLLNKRIEAVHPKVLLVFGMSVTKALLDIPIGQARAKQHTYLNYPIFATFAPNFLLKSPSYKKQAWEDLKKFQTFLKEKL